MFGFDAGTVSQNAYVTGIAIAILAIAALAAFAVWEESAEPRRRFVGIGIALGLGLPGNHRDDGACDRRRRGRDPGSDRALDDVPDPAAADHRQLRG